jgi:hypothetical protein
MTDEHFIVWMRSAGLPHFRKLWGKIDFLDAGKYVLSIRNEFVVQTFGGTKSIFITTTNSLGGKNQLLVVAYILAGIICILISFGFCLVESKDRRDIQAAKTMSSKLGHLIST